MTKNFIIGVHFLSRNFLKLSIFERGEVVGAWKCGIIERKIGEALNHPQSTIHGIIAAYRDHGSEAPLPRTGRLTIRTERNVRHLTRILKKNRKVNLQELREDFVSSTSTDVCTKTLSNCLHKQGFHDRVGVRKPFVSEKNRNIRLTWAKERKGWVNEWEKKYDVDCLIPTVKSGQQGVMVWGCFAKHYLGPLVKLEGKVTGAVYVDILKNYLLPFLDELDDQENFLFQEDNAPIHTAKIVKSWKKENGVNSIPWPAQSPDLNPIENLWDELERWVRAHIPLPKNKEHLWEILQEEWLNIDANKYQNLVNSMPHRIVAVIESKGYPTKY
ncbi:hypothetical protein RclHR1_10020002 [Rhizophagus clarus]|uniref:Tc1-like transposase DDE domain-containing protein n=1 Tax=Rhizophagus clarus TaxID=94130 RepID=A0A2Z6QR54_9GLOM|nr:hypothetical protein RclHR1_10020002 [Rhizophagus clarus]